MPEQDSSLIPALVREEKSFYGFLTVLVSVASQTPRVCQSSAPVSVHRKHELAARRSCDTTDRKS